MMASCQLRYVVPSTQCLITRHIVNAISAAMTTALASACSSSCISRPRIGARVISTADIDNDEFSCCTSACSHWSHLQLSMFLLKNNLRCSFQILDAQAALLVLDTLLLPVPQNASFKHSTSHTHARGLCPMCTPLHVLQQLSHLL